MSSNCGAGEASWESLGQQGDQTSHKGNQSWIFIGRTDAEAETPILWPPDVNWLIWKDLDAGKDWRQKEKEMTKDEMFGWHHWLDEHEFEQALGFDDGQGSLPCCSPWVAKTWLSDWTEVSSPKHLLFQSSCGSRIWTWLSWISFRMSHKAAIKYWLLSFYDLTREVSDSKHTQVDSNKICFVAGCWPKPSSVLCHKGLFT